MSDEEWWAKERVRTKTYRDRIRDRFNAQRREYYKKNRLVIRARAKKYKEQDPERVNAYYREYSKTDKHRAYRRRLRKHKHETDLNFRIKTALRTRIVCAIKGLHKSTSTIQLIGCDIGFLRLFLQARFLEGMTWANWGEWQIDHIIPCAEFDLRKPVQQKQCFNYTNLRPIWAKDNQSKGHKCPDSHQPEFL